jgi:hypothetical protein
LLQLQLSIVYLASVRWKVAGAAWLDGTAVSYALRVGDMVIVPAPQWFIQNPLMINVATWGALAVELSLGVLVWNQRLRRWVLMVGVLMHTSIMLTMAVGFFTPAMLVLYLAFMSPETVRQLPRVVRSRLASHRPQPLDTETSRSKLELAGPLRRQQSGTDL